MYNAASLAVVGDHSISTILRLLTSLELFLNADYYALFLKEIWDELDDTMKPDSLRSFIMTTLSFATGDKLEKKHDGTYALRFQAMLNCTLNTWSSFSCLIALSSVVNRPIQSIYSPRKNAKHFYMFTRLVKPRSGNKDDKFTVLWTSTKLSSEDPDHFVLCTDQRNIISESPNSTSNWLETHPNSTLKLSELSSTLNLTAPHQLNKPSVKRQMKLQFASIPSKIQHLAETLPERILPLVCNVETKICENLKECEKPDEWEKPKECEKFQKNSTEIESISQHVAKKVESMDTNTKLENSSRKVKGTCNRSCCANPPIPRGQAVKSEKYCDPNDIGLFFNKAMTDVEKYELITNVWKPDSNFDFPFHVDSKRHWRFQSTYINEKSPNFIPWLCYSAYLDSAFCLPCVLFGHAFSSHHGSQLKKLFTEPFTRWNGAPRRWEDHQKKSKMHDDATSAMSTLKRQMEGKEKRINEACNTAMRIRMTENRKKIKPIMKTVVLCGKQNIPLRGHRDDSQYKEDQTINPGNFQALLDYRIDGGDITLQKHFETAPKNATYRSKTIQNEIIACCKKYLQGVLVEEIKQAKFFSVLADEASDSSNKEQLSLVIRFIDSTTGDIREEFMEFIVCESISGEALADAIKESFKQLGLDINFLRGQSYDGAGNMAGARSGVSSRILQDHPKALYFHCASHRLNLVIAASCKLQPIRNMMDTVKKCSDIFRFSAKKQALFDSFVSELVPTEMRNKIPDVCRTRWFLRIDGLERTQEMYEPLLSTLEEIKDNADGSYNREACADANGVYSTMLSFNFIATLIITRSIMAYTLPLTLELQKKKIDVLSAYAAVDIVKQTLQQCRENVETKHNEWYQEAVVFAASVGVVESKPRTMKRQVFRQNQPADTPKEYYRRSLTIPFLDNIITEINFRFTKEHRIHSNGFFIIPTQVIDQPNWKDLTIKFAKAYQC